MAVHSRESLELRSREYGCSRAGSGGSRECRAPGGITKRSKCSKEVMFLAKAKGVGRARRGVLPSSTPREGLGWLGLWSWR